MITRGQPGFPLLRMGAKARVARPSVAMVLVLCAMLHVVGVCTDEGADEVVPSLSVQSPDDGQTLHDPNKVILAFIVHNFDMPRQGQVLCSLNEELAGNWTVRMNRYGESRFHVFLPEMSVGLYTVRLWLVDPKGEPVHDIESIFSFIVDPEASSSSSGLEIYCGEGDACDSDGDCAGDTSVCVKGACLCSADRFGDNCEHDVFASPAFTPDVDPQASRSRCLKSMHWYNGSDELYSELRALHFPSSCSENSVMLFEAPTHGFGANIHYITVAMTRAYKSGSAMVLTGNWTYGVHGMCSQRIQSVPDVPRGHSCYHMPYTHCHAGMEHLKEVRVIERNEKSVFRAPDSHFVPEKYSVKSHGVLWWRVHLMGYLLQPNARLQNMFQQALSLSGLIRPYIGMHVRRGDSCAHAETSTIRPKCARFEQYVEAARRMAAKYGVKHVYLATDDAEVAAEARGTSDLIFHVLDFDRTMFDSKWFIEYRLKYEHVDPSAVSDATMADLMVLREADYFVGTFASHFSRLAFELLVHNRGFVPPYISVDYPWCFHYLEERSLPGFGDAFC